MLLHPTILALICVSAISSLLLLYSSGVGLKILLRWNLKSGSEAQLRLERKTYLISTILAYVMGFKVVSAFLFAILADRLHPLFIGAMCAAGTLNANPYGYPALYLQLAGFFLAGLWLILNHADSRAWDYPLVRWKNLFLLALTPVAVAESVVLTLYVTGLAPDLIISCCGSLFGGGGKDLGADLAALPVGPTMTVFFALLGLILLSGWLFLARGKGALIFAAASILGLPVSAAAIISFISLYIYEMPTHHCPFDILQGGYGFIGYPLYLALFGGTLCGAGTGLLSLFSRKASLRPILPRIKKRLAMASLLFWVLFAAIVVMKIATSHLILPG